MSDDKPKSPKPRTAIEVAQALKPYGVEELLTELRRRGEGICTGDCNDNRDPADFREGPAEEARHRLERGELREAALWISRAHPHFARLPDLLARILPSAGL